MRTLFIKARSMSKKCGPTRVLRPSVPNPPPAVNCELVKQGVFTALAPQLVGIAPVGDARIAVPAVP